MNIEKKYSYWLSPNDKWCVGITVHPESDCTMTGKVELDSGKLEVFAIVRKNVLNEEGAKSISNKMNIVARQLMETEITLTKEEMGLMLTAFGKMACKG